MNEILREFLAESREALGQLDRDFVDLDRSPGDREALAGAFRRIHTIKGTCGFFGFEGLERLTHAGEGLLARLRDGEARFDAATATELRGLADAIRVALASIERTGEEGTVGPQPEALRAGSQSIGRFGSRLPSMIRDLARRCGRKARLEVEGEAIELDRKVLEAIRDPITHLVRNAVDHGIESPADRVRAGKPEEGRILLRAYRERGVVAVEMCDDGAGIDPARIREKAAALGLLRPGKLAELTDEEVLQLVFHPGLSTGEAAGTISGRGVGMDVVRTNVEAIGGAVDVRSVIGVGTTIRIRVPLDPAA